MSSITSDFVAKLAEVWHRFTLPEMDRQTLADMLTPMDDAGEAVAKHLKFDMEPTDYLDALEDLAPERKQP
jgi:hypothetical protein